MERPTTRDCNTVAACLCVQSLPSLAKHSKAYNTLEILLDGRWQHGVGGRGVEGGTLTGFRRNAIPAHHVSLWRPRGRPLTWASCIIACPAWDLGQAAYMGLLPGRLPSLGSGAGPEDCSGGGGSLGGDGDRGNRRLAPSTGQQLCALLKKAHWHWPLGQKEVAGHLG